MFAYVPGAVFKNLAQLASPAYTHRYYVDGAPNMGDVFYNNNWHTVLVGGLNKGGQGIYALDITNPDTFSASKVLWEFSDVPPAAAGDPIKGDPDLGYTYSRPAIVRLNNSKWAAIFGNGYNNTEDDGATTKSTTGYAALFIVDIETGDADHEDSRSCRFDRARRTDWQRRLPWTSTAMSMSTTCMRVTCSATCGSSI